MVKCGIDRICEFGALFRGKRLGMVTSVSGVTLDLSLIHISEGLLDPEMAAPIDGDVWSTKMATGAAMATYSYYDRIGGVETASRRHGIITSSPPLARLRALRAPMRFCAWS